MRKIFLNRWVFAFIGAALLCALIWFAGPLIGFGEAHPLDSEIVRYVVMGAVVLLIVILLLIGSLRARKKDEKLIEGVAGGPPPKDDKTQAIDAQRLTQRNKLTEALADMRKARGSASGGYLYEFPWYVIIGPPGAGKTTALLNSGQRFPLAERHGAQEIKGEGGTRNCDWYFTEKAVIIDTAGRYTTQDSDQSIDQAGWRNFLGLLKETRPSQPLNGVLVVFDVAYLIGRTQDERRADARAVRTRLIELQETFGLRLPVYVAFTKLDRIAGFTEFFDDLSREEREQVLGITFPYAEKGPPPHKGFSDAFDRLLTRLRGRLLDRLQAERDLARRNLIFGFPAQFASLRAIVDEMLTEAADESRFATPLLVRGIYFTSATQQGLPIDRLMGVLSSKFGVSQTQMPAQVGTGRGFFLQRLFEAVVYGEAGLVGANAAVVRRRRLIRIASFTAIGVVTVTLCGLWVWSYLENRALIDRVSTRVADLTPGITYAQNQPYGDGDTQPVRQLLSDLRELPTGYADQQARRVSAVGFGLYQGDWLGSQTAELYQRGLRSLLLPRLIARAQRRLFDNLRDPNKTYDALKTYLMLYDTRRLERNHIRSWFQNDWSDLPEPDRVALTAHLDALLADPWEPLDAINEALVAEARSRIRALTPAQAALARLQTGWPIRGWALTSLGIDNVSEVLTRQSLRPLNELNPGFFTVRCYYNHVLPRLPEVIATTSSDAWVFGQTQGPSQLEALQNEVIDLYIQGYIAQWESLLTDLSFPSVTQLRPAVQLLFLIGNQASPFRRLMQLFAREVQLTQPLPPPTAPGGASGGDRSQQIIGTSTALARSDACDPQSSIISQVGRGTIAGIAQAYEASRAALTQRLAGVNNPARAVDDRFRWLIDFAGNEGERLGLFAQKVQQTATQGSVLINQGGGAAELRQLLGQLETESQALLSPTVLFPMVQRLARQGQVIAYDIERANIVRAWSESVLPLCLRATQNKYPFFPGANPANDSPLDDFSRVFAPRTGAIDQFFENMLRRYVDTTNPQRYALTQPALNISQATLDQFSRAAAIREAFFPPQSGGALMFIFDVATQTPGTAGRAVVEIDTATLTIDQPQGPTQGAPRQMPTATVQWNGRGGARIVLDDVEVTKIDGPWAFLRLWQRSSPRPLNANGDQFLISPPGEMRLQLRARSRSNPFSVWQQLNNFRCVPIQ